MTRFVTMLLACVLVCSVAQAQGKGAPGAGDKKGQPKVEAAQFLVVDVSGELKLVDVKGLKEFKKKLGKDYKDALKEHASAKKQAKKDKQKFTDPKPKAPKLKVLSKKALPEAEAQAMLDKIAEERRKAAEKDGKKKSKK